MTDEKKGTNISEDEMIVEKSSEAPTDEKETSIAGEDGSQEQQEVSDEDSKEESGVKGDVDKQEKRIADLRKALIAKRAERRELEEKVKKTDEEVYLEENEDKLMTGPEDSVREQLKGEILTEMYEESIVGDFLRGAPAIYGDEKNVDLLKEYVHDRFKFDTKPNKAELKSAYDMAHSYLFGELEVLRAREEGKSEAYKQIANAEAANTPTGIKGKEREGVTISSEDRRIAQKSGIKPEVYAKYKNYYGDL